MLQRLRTGTSFLGLLGALSAALVGCGDSDVQPTGGAGGAGEGGGGGGAASVLEWVSCGELMECSELEVPIEPDDPSLGSLTLRLSRIPPLDTLEGTVILLNGGPGNPGTELIEEYGLGVRALLGASWAVVAMDVRGVEATLPFVRCGDAAETVAFLSVDTSPDDPVERTTLDAAVEAWHSGCVANTPSALLPRTGTVYAARDLEALRVALGEETLNLVGFSYGSLLAARYAELYPDRLRAVVIDSSMPPYVDPEALFRLMAEGYQDSLDRFLAWCAAGCEGGSDCFHGGEPVEEVRTAFLAARAQIEALELGRLGDAMLFRPLEEARWTELSKGLVDLEAGTPETLMGPPPVPRADGTFKNWIDSNNSIQMNDWDLPPGYSGATFDAVVASVAATTAPDVAPFLASYDPFYVLGEWSTPPTVPPPPFGPTTAPPMLFLAGAHDPSCPLGGVIEMRDAMANGSHLVVREADGHIQANNMCMGRIAADFILDPTTPPTATSCPDR